MMVAPTLGGRPALWYSRSMTETEGVKMYLDDVRPVPEGWVGVKSVNQAIILLLTGTVTEASLDHDLGDYAKDGGDGYKVVDWMAEHDIWPVDGVVVHSANPVGRQRIEGVINRYGPYGRYSR